MKISTVFFRHTGILVALSAGLIGSSAGVTTSEGDSGETARGPILHVKNGETLVAMDAQYFARHSILKSVDAVSEETTGASRLIDWDQWFGCFTLNNSNDVFASYMHYWDGVGKDVRLKCGTDVWGYKHIRVEHEADWQAKLNSARAAGWNSEAVGVESWDDLMSGATAGVVLWPEYRGVNAASNKVCGNSEFFLVDPNTGRELYSFRVEAVWASDSDRLISTLPTGRRVC